MSAAQCLVRLASIVVVGVLFVPLSSAQNVGFLKDSAVSYFEDKDVAMMMQAADDVLNDEQAPAMREWKNAETGNSGKTEVLKAFKDSAGIACKRLQFSNLAHNGVAGRSAYTFCKQTDKWMIVSKGAQQTPK